MSKLSDLLKPAKKKHVCEAIEKSKKNGARKIP